MTFLLFASKNKRNAFVSDKFHPHTDIMDNIIIIIIIYNVKIVGFFILQLSILYSVSEGVVCNALLLFILFFFISLSL